MNQTAESVGYRQLEIAPAVVGDLSHASGSYRTPQGVVSSAWNKDDRGRLTLKVGVPVGSTALVRVPADPQDHVTAHGSSRPTSEGRTADTANYRVGAGRYTFTVG
ncbi:alpha-L-rhamnosidase C-terminal domain-containing protein [Streptomyces canus]|uniref:alpha-L-rhamnosidase C-terminal domain-containing protein n=1 Tax=Streptomyces canus TaxID=58343 RepID=UPI0036B506D6